MSTKKDNWYKRKFASEYERLLHLRKGAKKEDLAKIDDTLRILEALFYEEDYFCEYYWNILERLEIEVERVSEIQDFMDVTDPLIRDKYFENKPKYLYFPKLSDDELLGLVHDFYKNSVDRETFKLFRGMFKKRNRLLHMTRLAEEGENPTALYLPYERKVHVIAKRNNTIEDVIDLAHEYGHGIQFLTNFDMNLFGDNSMFSEIVSVFFEMLCQDYLAGFDQFRDLIAQCRVTDFNSMKERSLLVAFESELLSYFEEIADEPLKNRLKLLNDEISCGLISESIYDIRTLLDSNLPEYFPYIIGYMMSIELVMIYKHDRDWAMYLLKELMNIDWRKSPEEYYESILNLGINPAEHLEEYKAHIILPKK